MCDSNTALSLMRSVEKGREVSWAVVLFSHGVVAHRKTRVFVLLLFFVFVLVNIAFFFLLVFCLVADFVVQPTLINVF